MTGNLKPSSSLKTATGKVVARMRSPEPLLALSARKTLLLVALIFSVSLTIRLYHLDSQSLECEELYTIPAATGHQYVYLTGEANRAQISFPTTTHDYQRLLTPESGKGLTAVNDVLRKNVHLPLYFYLMHYWIGFFGNSEWQLRFPSAVFGALAVVLIFLLGSELLNPLVGLVSALLLGFMPEQIHYSQQARMYPLLALLAISSTYAIALTRKSSTSRLPYLLFAVLSVAGLYTHYEYVFFLAAQTFYIWVATPLGRRKKLAWFVTETAIAVAFFPWLLIGITQSRTSPQIIAWIHGPLSSELVVSEIISKLTRLISVPEAPLGWLSVILAYGLLLLGLSSLRSNRATLGLLAAWIISPIAGVAILDHILGTRGISIMRYWMIIAPAIYILIAAGVQRINHTPVQLALIAVLGGFLFATAMLTAQGKLRSKPDRHKEMAQFVDQQISAPMDQLVLTEGVNSIPLALAYYGQRDFTVLREKWLLDQLGQRRLADITHGASEVLLLVSGQSQARKLLEENGYRLEGQPVQYGHVIAAKYILSPNQHAGIPSNRPESIP